MSLVSKKEWLVTTAFLPVNRELRRRVISRVLVFPHGLALQVTIEFERRDLRGEQDLWITAEDGLTIARARDEEQVLGTLIQTKYRESLDSR